MITTGHRSSLPPHVIIKKLRQNGWQLGNTSRDDLCPECARKPIQSHVEVGKKALSDMMAPMVRSDIRSLHFTEMLAVAATLDPDQARQLILVLRERIPKKPKTEKPKKPDPLDDTDYERWLGEQE